MNKKQRKELATIMAKIEAAASDYKDALTAAIEVVEPMSEDEQEKFDNLSEGLQQSEKGQDLENAANLLGELKDKLSAALEAAEEVEGADLP